MSHQLFIHYILNKFFFFLNQRDTRTRCFSPQQTIRETIQIVRRVLAPDCHNHVSIQYSTSVLTAGHSHKSTVTLNIQNQVSLESAVLRKYTPVKQKFFTRGHLVLKVNEHVLWHVDAIYISLFQFLLVAHTLVMVLMWEVKGWTYKLNHLFQAKH